MIRHLILFSACCGGRWAVLALTWLTKAIHHPSTTAIGASMSITSWKSTPSVTQQDRCPDPDPFMKRQQSRRQALARQTWADWQAGTSLTSASVLHKTRVLGQ